MITDSAGGPSKLRALLSSVFIMGLGLLLAADATTANEASPGSISFIGKNFFGKAKGVFHSFRIVETHVDLETIETGYVVVEVDVASLDTDNEDRDEHLRTADFFEVERWPLARIRLHSATQTEGDRYAARFDVEIRDIKKTLVGEFEIVSREPLSVRGSLTIDRIDFGIGTPKNWNPVSITNEIPVTFEASLPSGAE